MTIDEAIHLESYDEQRAARSLLQYSDEKNAFVEQLLVRAERWMNGRTS
ncbi:hypothetical protein [Paenibacillus glucanolyticus]|nr:hypothetical protein [Paenibacillus glucanolyticus]